ncbi:MAG: glycoside hydrolase family 44 protein [Oscillospiraceae bacterium]|nr:glycoside hydrolase family 44 protein [Oscillospiraceae bacterium]
MFKRSFAGLFAGICLIASTAPTMPALAEESDSYSMKVSVNLSGEKKEISPYIYGVNEYGTGSNLKNITVKNTRQGGNRYTGYNWETNWSNAGEDWMHSSDTNIGDASDGAGYAARKLSETCEKYNIPYKMATLQMAGYVAADKNGTVTEAEAAPSARWNKVEFRKNGELSLTPDLTDNTVYMDEYVNYLVKTLGDASTSTGIQAYSLDNEPVLWNDTHPRIHSEEVTNKELVSKSIELAKVVKEIDPKAEVFGPAFWGMLPCIQISESDSDWQTVKNNYSWYLDYYLQQMADAEKESGKRLLDVIDVHYYAQDCSTDEARLQAARSLYDPDYVENSWLQPYMGQYFPFIPNIQESIDKYYPGTKIGISEYNLANIADEKNTGKSVVSAIAETEALGCFADNGVYFATYWGTLPECPYVESAINLYTNYDGEGASFGDTLVTAKTEDISKATAYASVNGDDDSNVTMVLSNKDMSKSENAVISLEGTSTNYKSAVVYAVTQDSSDIRIIDVQNDLSGNNLTVELPPLSVAQIVLSDKPTDKKVYEAPDIRTEEITYKIEELELSQNGYPMIPLGDKANLKNIVINTTAYSNAGSSYGGGGGGLCFNHVIPNGKTDEVWASKAVSWSLGTADVIIPFDDEFTVVKDPVANTSEVVNAVCNDEYAELQGSWWKYSEKNPNGEDITVEYNSITLVYEYENTSGNTIIHGDATLDGNVDIADVVALASYIGDPENNPLSAQAIINCDVQNTGDGLTSGDILMIQQYIAEIIKALN